MENKFHYQQVKETELAVLIRIPYYQETGKYEKKHKQLYAQTWIPKSVLNGDSEKFKTFALNSLEQNRTKNQYQKLTAQPISWRTLGQYAPVKKEHTTKIVDSERLRSLINELEKQSGVDSLRVLVNRGDETANLYYNASQHLDDERIPTKIETTYL